MSTAYRRRGIGPRRDAIAYHEAGHAVVGHAQGLRFSRIYVGDAGGHVVFDHQWSEDAVLEDAALLDRYALMLLAATSAEFRRTGTVVGAGGDIAALAWLLRRARERGTAPRSDRWRRADAEVLRRWSAIAAVADELAYRSTPVPNPAALLSRHPDLGTTVDEVTGTRARQLLTSVAAATVQVGEDGLAAADPARPRARGSSAADNEPRVDSGPTAPPARPRSRGTATRS